MSQRDHADLFLNTLLRYVPPELHAHLWTRRDKRSHWHHLEAGVQPLVDDAVRLAEHDDVYVGLQVGREPCDLVPGDASTARWETDVQVVDGPDGRDFRGAAVQGRRGERFVYLTWGSVHDGSFEMFRRAKLMLTDAPVADSVTASVHLTDDCGMPRCARLGAPAVEWRAS